MRMLGGRTLGRGGVLWGEVVLVDPVGEWFGEESVVAAGVVEVVGGVDEGGGAWGVSVGPVGPGVEGVEAVLDVEEPVVVAVELSGELSVDGEVLLEPVAFVAELVSLVEQWLGAPGDLAKSGRGGGDVVGAVGDGVSCGATVESSGGGEFSFGLTLPLLGVVEIAGELSDGVVVRYAVWFEVDSQHDDEISRQDREQ